MNTRFKEETNKPLFVPVLSNFLSFAYFTKPCGTMWELHELIIDALPNWLEECKKKPGQQTIYTFHHEPLGVGVYCEKSEIFTVESNNTIFRFKDNGNPDVSDRQSQEFSMAFICLLCEELGDKTFGQLLDDGKNANSLEANHIAYHVLLEAIDLESKGNTEGHLTLKSRSGELSVYIKEVTNMGFRVVINHTRLGCDAKIKLRHMFPCITNLKAYSKLEDNTNSF